jgi:conjugal transfer ATP-binding protein TraC
VRVSVCRGVDDSFADERLVVFEARAILKNNVLFPLFCLIVMDLFSKKISTLPRNVPKELINDEALDFLTDPKMGPFLGFQYRTARKMGAGISLATQNVEFIEKLAPIVVSSITVNTSTYIILSHKGFESLYPKMQSILSFTDNDIEILDSLQDGDNYREEFIKVGNIAKAYRIGISEMANAVYSTTPDVVAKINKLYRERKNYKAAVIQYVENLKKECA